VSNENFRLLNGRFYVFPLDFFLLHLQLENSLVALVKGKSNQGIYNNVKYVDINFNSLYWQRRTTRIQYKKSYVRFFSLRKLYADISYYFEFRAPNLRQIVMLRVT